jgi:hypothetical protein
VYLRLLDDGMAELGGFLPAGLAVRARAAIEGAAHARPDNGEGIDARRADAMISLLTGDLPPVIEIVLRATDGEPVSVPGLGPLDADSIREMVGPAAKVVVQPLGCPPEPTTAYRPSTGLDRWVRASDPTCRFPGCRQPSKRCDLDHVHPFGAGGQTCACNLIPLCRRHHRLKTFHDWTPVLLPDRSVLWTDPAGLTHWVPPPDD